MDEAPVVVTAATGALGPVVANLSTLLRRDGEYKLRRGTRKDIKLIRSKLKSIHSILWVTWEREDVDAEGKELRMEAWRLADDMNDAIDDFILSLKRNNDGRHFIQAKIEPSRPFMDLKRRADDVSQRCRSKWKTMETSLATTFSSLFSTTKTTVGDFGPGKRPRVVDPYVPKDISELVKVEESMNKLMEHLVEEEGTPQAQQVKMASILGAAGVGKTTLARHVYEAVDKDKFKARAFVSITSCHNMIEVLASILRQVAADSPAILLAGTKAATEKRLIGIISNFLNDKRYLVIIDDIWHCGQWETIKKSLPDNNLGSRIVTTSRDNSITDKWRDDFSALVHKIDHNIGSASDAWVLSNKMFAINAEMIGKGFDGYNAIVAMCVGMPLALVCMMSALAKERERQEQQAGLSEVSTRDVQDTIEKQVMRNGIQNTPGFEPLVESLELGYNHLPHHMLKTCLLYSSIYPEGYGFSRDGLIGRWIAEGFVRKEEAAKDYFDELVSWGLFHKIQTSQGGLFYKLHPMMRNYLRRKLREDNFITCTSDGVPSSPVGRLCIDDNWQNSDLGIDWHHIRSLVVFEDAEKVPYKHLQHLRVLDVRYNALENQYLKDMCGGLLRLRHLLGLHGAGISEIPTEIARVQYLETLEVTSTKIKRLPAEMGDLKQLKTLDVSWNQELAELPREMGNLQHLETLLIPRAKIRTEAWEIIGTLKKLKTLDVSGNEELSGIPRDIGELQQLKKLNVSRNSRITELPKEIGNLQQLVHLDLCSTRITKVPRDIGRLQHLEYLNLSATTLLGKMPREVGGLQNLKYFKDTRGILPFEAGRLPKLEELPKWVRQAWKNSDLVSTLAGEMLSFQTTGWIDQGRLVVGMKHINIPQWIKEHFNNIGGLDIRICKLEEQDLKILQEMPNLQVLKLSFVAVPIKPIVISSGGFAKLKTLGVVSRVPRLTFQEGAMPRLESLEFLFQFYGGPPNTVAHPMGIKHLGRLDKVSFLCNKWYKKDSPCISVIIRVVRKEAWEHPNRIKFDVLRKIIS